MNDNLIHYRAENNVKMRQREKMLIIGQHWCTKCNQYKSVEEFSISKHARFGYHWWCKSCHNKSRKGMPHIKGRARQYNRELKSHYKTLAGGKCVKCGYNKTQGGLDFHHVNPDEKEGQVSTIINTGKHNDIMHEMNKCVLLCSTCHKEFGAYAWTAEFVKSDGVGYEIKPDSITEYPEEYWAEPSVKITHSQKSLF